VRWRRGKARAMDPSVYFSDLELNAIVHFPKNIRSPQVFLGHVLHVFVSIRDNSCIEVPRVFCFFAHVCSDRALYTFFVIS